MVHLSSSADGGAVLIVLLSRGDRGPWKKTASVASWMMDVATTVIASHRVDIPSASAGSGRRYQQAGTAC